MDQKFRVEAQFKNVFSFDELVDTAFQGKTNAICWKRNLSGDFKEIAEKLELREDVTEILPEHLMALHLSENGSLAREIILSDLMHLNKLGASPVLNLIKCYPRDEELDFISTDVYSYHVDRSPVPTDTFLCTYFGAASDIIANNQAEQKVLIPEIRKQLMELYGGPQKEFDQFITENYFDLHYSAKPDAQPINLGNGNLWKLAVDHPQQKAEPCIHRAPVERKAELRLLLIC